MHATTSAKRLTSQQAEELWRAWATKKDKAARDKLVLAYSPMVRYLASRKVREIPSLSASTTWSRTASSP